MIASLRELYPAGASPTEAPPRHVGPYRGLAAILPQRKRPGWVGQIGRPKRTPPAPTPDVAHAQMRDKTRRARRSLRQRGVKGFMAALHALPPL